MTEVKPPPTTPDFDPVAHAEVFQRRLDADVQHTAEYRREAAIRSAETDRALGENSNRLLALPPSEFTSKVQAELISNRIQKGLKQIPFLQKIPRAQPLLDKIEALRVAIPENVAGEVPNQLIKDAEEAWKEIEPLGKSQREAHTTAVTERLAADSVRTVEYNREAALRARETDKALRRHRAGLLSTDIRAIPKIGDLKGASEHLPALQVLLDQAKTGPVSHQVPSEAETALAALEEIRWTREPRHPLSPARLVGFTDKRRRVQ